MGLLLLLLVGAHFAYGQLTEEMCKKQAEGAGGIQTFLFIKENQKRCIYWQELGDQLEGCKGDKMMLATFEDKKDYETMKGKVAGISIDVSTMNDLFEIGAHRRSTPLNRDAWFWSDKKTLKDASNKDCFFGEGEDADSDGLRIPCDVNDADFDKMGKVEQSFWCGSEGVSGENVAVYSLEYNCLQDWGTNYDYRKLCQGTEDYVPPPTTTTAATTTTTTATTTKAPPVESTRSSGEEVDTSEDPDRGSSEGVVNSSTVTSMAFIPLLGALLFLLH